MKKYLLPILIILMLSLVACGDDDEDSTGSSPDPTVKTPITTQESGIEGSLNLVVVEPEDESIVDNSRITVSGGTEPDAVVSINGIMTEVDLEGNFSGEVNLEAGPNLIEVVASDFYGDEDSVLLTVVYVAQLPLTVYQPMNESEVYAETVTVSGTTNVDAVVSVNDDIVSVDESGGFSAEVTLELGPNLIEVVASDFEGNSTAITTTVIYIEE